MKQLLFTLIACSLLLNTASAQSADQLDPALVTYLHRSIKDWSVTSTITQVTFSPLGTPIGQSELCLPHTKQGQWPVSKLGDPGQEIDIEGNPWVFAEVNGKWYGATFDWLRPNQVCKGERLETLGLDQIRIPPMNGGWVPKAGEWLCFAMSTRARDGVFAGMERSNIACAPVPGAVPGPPPPRPTAPGPVVPPPGPQPPPGPAQPPVTPPPNEGVLLAHVQDVQRKLDVLQSTASETLTQVVEHRKEVRSRWERVMGWVGRNLSLPAGSALVAWLLKP